MSLNQVAYTICPVLVGSHVAVQKGWLAEELAKVGVTPRYLRSLPYDNWLSHFTHTLPNSFRDGGNIPAIWTRSQGVRTRLVGLTFSGNGGCILVLADSDIHRISDLKGRKIGLYQRHNSDRVDFWRATAERGILLALGLGGLDRKDVEIVDLQEPGPDYPSTEPSQSPAHFNKRARLGSLYSVEPDALLSGKVDAIYSNRGRAQTLEAEGKTKVIADLGLSPDWTVQVANSPYTITVSEDLAQNHPEIVTAYLRAAVRGGRWVNGNHAAAGTLFSTVTSYWTGTDAAQEISGYDFVPNLSRKNIAGIEIEKKFLLEHGYMANDFDVQEWVDGRFLQEALGAS